MFLEVVHTSARPIVVNLKDLSSLTAVGVVGGELWIHGSAVSDSGQKVLYKWKSLPVRIPCVIRLRMLHNGEPSDPIRVAPEAMEYTQRRLAELANHMQPLQVTPSSAMDGVRPKHDHPCQVVLQRRDVYLLSCNGQHVQIEVDYGESRECRVKIWWKVSADHVACYTAGLDVAPLSLRIEEA